MKIIAVVGATVACAFASYSVHAAQPPAKVQESVLGSFAGQPDSADPEAALVADKAGDLYGTTQSGGASGKGSVFELSPPKKGKGAWTKTVIVNFTEGADGGAPFSTMLIDDTGSLYGTTEAGGTGRGVVFELTPPKKAGGNWTEIVLHTFGVAPDGFAPFGNLAFDKSGNLYGTTVLGGDNFGGVVFQLTPPKSAHGEWTAATLHSFAGDTGMGSADGANPFSGVLYDPSTGSFYGTTLNGGPDNFGAVFRLAPDGHGEWQETVLYTFKAGTDGANPSGQMVLDDSGVLYGATDNGGKGGYGVIYSLTPNAKGTAWKLGAVHSFTGGNDGEGAIGGLTADVAGNLFGTTIGGGKAPPSGATCTYSGDALAGNFRGTLTNCGTVFQLQKSGAKWNLRSLYSFRGVNPSGFEDGNAPDAAIIFGPAGTLYGTTTSGGSGGRGIVFKLTY